MSESYSPDPGVDPEGSYATALLSQRDLSLRIPINYVTSPGVSFTAACFSHLRFEDDNSGDCLSNLLAVGFRRFEIDLYWDQERSVWSFCPAAVPSTISNSPLPTTVTISSPTEPLVALTSDAEPTPSQAAITSGVSSGTTASGPATSSGSTIELNSAETSLGTSLPSISILPDSPNEPLVSIGPYLCTTTINLSTFTSQLLDYILKTENTLGAHMLFVFFNIHASASNAHPLSSTPTPSNLPGPSNLVGNLFAANLSQYIYTPTNLMSDRLNLNASWYAVADGYRPVEDYYHTTSDQNGIISTQGGWPSESYVEFSKGKRLLLGWGTVDPQLSGYNFSGDSGTVFPNGYIQDFSTNVSADSSGDLTRGCFMLNNIGDVSQVNSSWAADATLPGFDYPTSASANIVPLLNLTTNTTNCGTSPYLNVTLLNSTAHENYRPYQNYSYATIWSWAPNEPRDYSPSDASSESLFRCATTNIDLSGRWVVADCSQYYYAACRANGQPYNWSITNYPISYSYANQACPDNYAFAAPRTALENSYLSQAMRESRREYDGHGACWVDFNDLDTSGCWVTGGPNATCPYNQSSSQADYLKRRVILVPTVAAIIVLIITALTIFVKAAGNRKTRKRNRKRADNGITYEGIPS